MASEKISAMPDAGALVSTDLFPIVRLGSPNLNLSTSFAHLVGGGAGSLSPVATKTTSYVLLSSDSQVTFDNTGASGLVIFSLPPFTPGLKFCFIVTTAQTLEVLAGAGDRIAIATQASSLGGNIQSNSPYSAVCLIAPNGATNSWVVTSILGPWDLV